MSIIKAIAADEIAKGREPIIQAMASSMGRSNGSTATETLTAIAGALRDATIADLRSDTSSAAALTVSLKTLEFRGIHIRATAGG